MQHQNEIYPVTESFLYSAHVNSDTFDGLYRDSIKNPQEFWKKQAQRIHWSKPFSKISQVSWNNPVDIRWFEDGELNACYNCVDRHLPHHADRVAFHWEPDSLNTPGLKITYQQLHENVCRMANVLVSNGVKRGDRVTIYMPMIPEAVYSMLACARIGAIHSVIFGGFSPDSISSRMNDCESEFLITADEGRRGGKKIPLKTNADLAVQKVSKLQKVFVVRHTGAEVAWVNGRDVDLKKEMTQASPLYACANMKAEDPLFILYTSGSTGKPKGVLHTTGGYMVYASLTHHFVFDYKPNDTYWCAADIGWITGHSYIVYGPLSNAATQVLFEGLPNWPDSSRIWQIIDRYKVNILYTAPTLIRALMAQGEDFVKTTSRESLRILGSVGEPINPEAWYWYYKFGGREKCPIVDTWWQTETGGIMITPLPGATALKPGSATRPFFGIQPVVLDEKGNELEGEAQGILALKGSWPGQMRGVYKDPEKFYKTYFSQFSGYYFTGDGCRRDADGYYWVTGRIDDVLNVSGHRIGTAEVESALVSHHSVSESAAVGVGHSIKGQALYVFVTLKKGITPTEQLKKELIHHVGTEIGAHAKPDFLQWAPGLPKTRSGKIMRRILRKVANNELDSMGDTTTLADPIVVEDLIRNRLQT